MNANLDPQSFDISDAARAAAETDGNREYIPSPGEFVASSPLPQIIDATDFLAETISLPQELVSSLFHQGSKIVLGGGSKTFKTWTLLDLAVSVASGQPWLSFPTIKGRVLFLNFEIQSGFFQHRIKAIVADKGVTLSSGQLDVWNLRGHCASYHIIIPRVIERVKAAHYVLIILDPVYKLYGNTDENSAGGVAQLLNSLELLTTQTGAAVAFGAHYSKGNQSSKENIDRISGSGVFARDPDTILNFTRHEEDEAFTVEATLRNLKPIAPFVVRWQYPLMKRADELDPSKLRQPGGGRPSKHDPLKLLAVIRDRTAQNPISVSDWATQASISRSTLNGYLKQMRSLGWVVTIGEGNLARQCITDRGLSALQIPPKQPDKN